MLSVRNPLSRLLGMRAIPPRTPWRSTSGTSGLMARQWRFGPNGISSARHSSTSTKSYSGGQPEKKHRSKTFQAIFGALLAAYSYDTLIGNGIVNRVVGSFYTLGLISIDYKLNFDDEHDVAALHERNAQRLYDLVTRNKGIYIKMGQMLSLQGFMFPKQYQEKFKLMFDQAPHEDWSLCDETLRNELGTNYRTEVFSSLEEEPIASASIAQVHRGVLKDSGKKVAVKIQKQSVSNQVGADLFTYRFAMRMYGFVFNLPLEVVSKYVSDKCREELDFTIEYKNAENIRKLVDNDPEIKGAVYIPEYYPEHSTKKILIGEWIDGSSVGEYMKLKDQGYDIKQLMEAIVKVYSRQVFAWGCVHCDLHPGNLIVRHVSDKRGNTRQQLVILDHGLYEYFTDKFRKEYSEFWKYSMERNVPKFTEVLDKWGIRTDHMMLAAAGMGDSESNAELKAHMKEMHSMSYFQRQQLLNQRMREFLQNTDKFPMCLTFVMRSMRIVQGLNRNFGSPVNRMSMLVSEANRTVNIYEASQPRKTDFHSVMMSWRRTFTFVLMKFYTFLTYEVNRIDKLVANLLHRNDVKDLEEVYEDQLNSSGESMGFDEIPSTDSILA